MADLWDRVSRAESAAAPLTGIDADDLPVTFGCEASGFDPVDYLNPKEARRMDRATQLGVGATVDAIDDAGDLQRRPRPLRGRHRLRDRGISTLEAQAQVLIDKGVDRVSPFLVPMMMANATAGIVAMRFRWTAPACRVSRPARRRPTPSARR